MIIDYHSISDDALNNICKEYVIAHINELDAELNIKLWIKQTKEQVKAGELLIEYSQVDNSVSLKNQQDIVNIPTQEFK